MTPAVRYPIQVTLLVAVYLATAMVFQKPVRVEDDEPAAVRMLAEGEQNLPLGQSHRLRLMNALAERVGVATDD